MNDGFLRLGRRISARKTLFGFFTFLQFFRSPIKLKKRNFLLHKNFREVSKSSGNPNFLVFSNLYGSRILDTKIDELEREKQFLEFFRKIGFNNFYNFF